jgi:hypothetical protein
MIFERMTEKFEITEVGILHPIEGNWHEGAFSNRLPG